MASKPCLERMPLETVELIIQQVNKTDLKALRLVSSTIKSSATKQFAKQYFSRIYVQITPSSLAELSRITGHEYFGRFVQTLNFGCIWPYRMTHLEEHAEGPVLSHSGRLLCQALKHMRTFNTLINIEINDHYGDRGQSSPWLHDLMESPPYISRNAKYMEMFEVILWLKSKIATSGLTVAKLAFEFEHYNILYLSMYWPLVLLEGNPGQVQETYPTMGLEFHVGQEDDTHTELVWKPQVGSLSIIGEMKWVERDGHRARYWPLLSTHDQVPSQFAGVTSVTITKAGDLNPPCLRMFEQFLVSCNSTLQHITIKDMTLFQKLQEGPVQNSLWSLVLHTIATAENLKSFEMHNLRREVYTMDFSMEAYFLEIQDRVGHGNGVQSQLLDIAAFVEANETAWEALSDDHPHKWTDYTEGHRLKTLAEELQLLPTRTRTTAPSQGLKRSRGDDEHLTDAIRAYPELVEDDDDDDTTKYFLPTPTRAGIEFTSHSIEGNVAVVTAACDSDDDNDKNTTNNNNNNNNNNNSIIDNGISTPTHSNINSNSHNTADQYYPTISPIKTTATDWANELSDRLDRVLFIESSHEEAEDTSHWGQEVLWDMNKILKKHRE
jgi:hypothetical protein